MSQQTNGLRAQGILKKRTRTLEMSMMSPELSPSCEKAVRTLMLGVSSKEPIESIGFVFRDLESAWASVDERIQ